uniref:Cytochrome c biogenesis protein CcsB n=1 Tax=Pleonosporium borreri TaxID=2575635 RepID=A0A4D6WYU9_9FLOR|nr:cytochrome c biogenesis protein ccs1 [Pleonosporium borreri]
MSVFNLKNFIWKTIKKLANLNFAIFILFIIIFFSFLGSIIEQDQNIVFYQINYPIINTYFSIFNWKFITILGLDHIYSTWWFIMTILIFSMSLIVCTFSIQLPSLQNARRWKFINYGVNKRNIDLQQYNTYDKNSLVNIMYSLMIYDYYIFHKKNYIYAYKGLVGRIAPIFVHLSIIIILIGSFFSVSSSFMIQEMVADGEIFHFTNIIHAGPFSHISRNTIACINNFFIDYNPDNSIKQFLSDISITDNLGNILKQKVIAVNSPLIFKGLVFYQTDWSIDALRIKIGSDYIVQKKIEKVQINNRSCWLCNIITPNNQHLVIFLFDLTNNLYIYNIDQDIVFSISLKEIMSIDNINISIDNIMTSTGLQVKVDPGIVIIYLGFAMVIISIIASYISYTQIWVNLNMSQLKFAGMTNRAVLFFEEDMNKINKVYQKYTF